MTKQSLEILSKHTGIDADMLQTIEDNFPLNAWVVGFNVADVYSAMDEFRAEGVKKAIRFMLDEFYGKCADNVFEHYYGLFKAKKI